MCKAGSKVLAQYLLYVHNATWLPNYRGTLTSSAYSNISITPTWSSLHLGCFAFFDAPSLNQVSIYANPQSP